MTDDPQDQQSDAIITLSYLDRGQFIGKLSKKLDELVAGVLTVEKKGKLTITLDVTPEGKGQVSMTPTLKMTLPERSIRPTSLFMHQDGQLGIDDPQQTSLLDAQVMQPNVRRRSVMETGVRRDHEPAQDHDPETGEIRN